MTEILPSYLEGAWRAGSGDAVAVRDAVTGEEVCGVTAGGLDLGAAVQHAREVGGPALAELDFGARVGLVKAAAQAVADRKQELYDLSARAGATRADAKVDVDGGFGTALAYAGLGKRGLPADGRVIAADEPVPLGREGAFVGRHVLATRRGVAVQINAFNFPVWGLLEKLAPALLAGVPTLVKPATPTAYVAEHAVRIMLESGALPEGALQLLCGSAGDLLDHLGGQDSVAFTGSAETAARLRAHDAVTRRSVRFNAEADSVNSSVLGPDAADGTPERDLFLDAVVTEMTVKAGQKCTAIRRAFVPADQLAAVGDALADRLAGVTVGAPGAEGVTMGALVGLDQRQDVRDRVAEIASGATLVHGDPASVEVVGADAERGAFLAPLLLRADDPGADVVHRVEAFGPVSTLVPYESVADLVGLVARGEGSLAASVVSADPGFVRESVHGMAPYHGRILVLDRDSGAESTGHGTPLPHLVHGGPGRAGGGQEEAGLRAVHAHMQLTALQGAPDVLAGLAGDSAE